MSSSASTADGTRPSRRIAQMIYLRPECIDEYKRIHADVWPGVLEQIKDSNISDYSIYLTLKPRPTLFATLKYTPSDPSRDLEEQFREDMERMGRNPKVQEWWQVTDAMQETLVEGSKGSTDHPWWLGMEEVFRLE